MTEPAHAFPITWEQILRQRAADEILIAAIFGLSEHEDTDGLTTALPPRADLAPPAAVPRAWRG